MRSDQRRKRCSPTGSPWDEWRRPWIVDDELDIVDAHGDLPYSLTAQIGPDERPRFVLWLNALPEDWARADG